MQKLTIRVITVRVEFAFLLTRVFHLDLLSFKNYKI